MRAHPTRYMRFTAWDEKPWTFGLSHWVRRVECSRIGEKMKIDFHHYINWKLFYRPRNACTQKKAWILQRRAGKNNMTRAGVSWSINAWTNWAVWFVKTSFTVPKTNNWQTGRRWGSFMSKIMRSLNYSVRFRTKWCLLLASHALRLLSMRISWTSMSRTWFKSIHKHFS